MEFEKLSQEEINHYHLSPVGKYTVRDVQNKIFILLSLFDKICRENHLSYILDSGTMLGAIRNQGFIPWDDDADVAMLRKDYQKFVKLCKKGCLPEGIVFEDYHNCKEHPYNFGKIIMSGTTYEEPVFSSLNTNKGLWLDVFPIDNTTTATYKIQGKIAYFWRVVRSAKTHKTKISSRPKWIFSICSFFPYSFINFQADFAMRFFDWFKTKNVCKLCHPGKGKVPHSRQFYLNLREIPFESSLFFIPSHYEEWLRQRYSNPYKLPDEQNRKPEHVGGKVAL